MLKRLKKITSTHVLIGLFVLLVLTVVKFSPWQNAGQSGKLIAWDVTSYYAYLPATFIEEDLSLSFVEEDSAFYHHQQMYWPETAPNGGKVIKTTMGLSFLYSPFFFIAKAVDNDKSKTQGFSKTFEFWLVISCLFYTLIGGVFLRLFLLRHFSDIVVSITLVALYLGTNLFYYITIEPLMPHAYNFALMAIFLSLTDKWYSSASVPTSILLGVVFGLITLIRPVNGIVFVFFILYQVNSWAEMKERIRLLISKPVLIMIIVLFSFLVVLPQLLYWHKVTGSFFFDSYPGERFFFTQPHLIDGLFSYRKGWLLYTPIMLFGIIGLFLNEKNRIGALFVLIPTLYIMFSWWNWWYGGGFGCRPIIDFYPILAIGIATFVMKLGQVRWRQISMGILGLLLVTFNLFQTLQKKSDAIHWDSMTKEAYWHNFLHRYPQPGLEEKLRTPDEAKAKKGLVEY